MRSLDWAAASFQRPGHKPLFSPTEPQPSARGRTIQVLDHILALHTRPSLTLEEIAGRLRVSGTDLSDALNRVSCRGFLDHLHAVRVLHATALLADSPDSIAMIARACGDYCAPQLNRHFGHHVHTTPTRFRGILALPCTAIQRSFSEESSQVVDGRLRTSLACRLLYGSRNFNRRSLRSEEPVMSSVSREVLPQ